MGERLENFKPSVRYTNGVTIYFQTKSDILVWDNKTFIKISRYYFPPKNYYRACWKPFLEKLYRNNNLETVWDVASLANRYEAVVVCPRLPEPPPIPDDILVRPSKFIRGKTMGIIKPTNTHDYDIVIYSKDCIGCQGDDKTRLLEIEAWALHNNLDVIKIRTSYKPADHKRAAEIYGSEYYPTFVVYDDVKTLKEFAEMIKDTDNKLAKPERNKGDLQDMQRAKGSRRKARVASKRDKAQTENEE